MGEDESWQEDGLAPYLWGRKRDSHLGRVIRFSALVAHKSRRMGRSTTPNILPILVLCAKGAMGKGEGGEQIRLRHFWYRRDRRTAHWSQETLVASCCAYLSHVQRPLKRRRGEKDFEPSESGQIRFQILKPLLRCQSIGPDVSRVCRQMRCT